MNLISGNMEPEGKVRLTVKFRTLILIGILFFTLGTGFVNSLNVEYGGNYTTFLFLPDDLHADLIKTALSFPPFGPIDDSTWNPIYRDFYEHNPYGGIEAVQQGKLTDLHLPPFVLLLMLGLKRAILALGPSAVVGLYYAICLTAVVLIASKFGESALEKLLISAALTLSYPFLMILSRGSFGGFFTSLALMGVIYETLIGKRLLVAALSFAIALNFRPNAVLFLPVFLLFGTRGFLTTALAGCGAAAVLGLVSYLSCVHFYPGYNYSVFVQALHVYYRGYAVSLQEPSANSLFGALSPVIELLHLPPVLNLQVEQALISLSSGYCLLLMAVFVVLYLREQIGAYEYAFAVGVLYIVGTTVFSPYHLFFLFIFILLAGYRRFPFAFDDTQLLILMGTAFVLIPKNYAAFRFASPDGELNPLCLLALLLLIFLRRGPAIRRLSWKLLSDR